MELRLTRYGYNAKVPREVLNVKPREVRALLRANFPPVAHRSCNMTPSESQAGRGRLGLACFCLKGTHRSRSDPALVGARKIWAKSDQKEGVCAGAGNGIECPGEICIALRV